MKKNVKATTTTIKHRLFDGTEILTHYDTRTIVPHTAQEPSNGNRVGYGTAKHERTKTEDMNTEAAVLLKAHQKTQINEKKTHTQRAKQKHTANTTAAKE